MASADDVRRFYAGLGIELAGWARHDACVRCFADPAAHAHEDRRASCSVSLDSGAWKCHGCGAHGGAYDAALTAGHTPRAAIDLMIACGLTEARAERGSPRGRRRVEDARTPRPAVRAAARPLAAGEADVARWHDNLFGADGRRVRERSWHQRRWSEEVMDDLELGYDGERLTIPIRGARGQLQGVLRYRVTGAGPKMLAVPGTRLGLIPHPARERSEDLLLVEGPPDMLAARSRGRAAIAVPGARAWQAEWASLLACRAITVVMDCDRDGRQAAERIAAGLRPVAAVRVIDLAPRREDGYDLTNWLLAHPLDRSRACKTSFSPKPTKTR